MRISRRCLCLVVAAGIGCRGAARRPSVFLVSIDTLRADHLPAYGYRDVATPNIDRLARDSVVFDEAYSHVPLTLPSHVTMFTGRLPYENGVRDNLGYRLAANIPTAAELLRARGYATGAAVSASVLDPSSGIERGFDLFDAAMDVSQEKFAERPGTETWARLSSWLAARAGRPVFGFLHLYEPHAPYTPPEPFRTRYAAHPYDGEIAAADAVVGEFLDFLREHGLYDRSLVILLSDHGEGLGDHGEQEHGVLLYREDLHVPLVMHLPGGASAGRRISEPVGLVDVFPTLVETAGADPAPSAAARSLRAALKSGGRSREIYAETLYPRLIFGWSDLASLIDDRFQYIDSSDPELYDLRIDPGERHSIDPGGNDAGRQRRRELLALDRKFQPPGAADPEQVRRLASLGYLSATTAADQPGPRPNPRDRIASFENLKRAAQPVAAGRPGEAIPVVAAFQRENPQYAPGWTELAHLQEAVGDFGAAERSIRAALKLTPRSEEGAIELARLLIRRGAVDEAAALASDLAATTPKTAAIIRARIALMRGDPRQAAEAMKAIAPREAEAASRELALEAEKRGKPEIAILLLEPFASSDDAQTIGARGVGLSETGRHSDAVEVLRRGVELHPRDPLLHQDLGIALLRAGTPRPAVAELQQAIALDGSLVESWNALGVAQRDLGAPEEALDAWRHALSVDPLRYDCLFNMSVVAADAGKIAVAREALEKFIASAPPREFGDDIRKARAILRGLGERREGTP